MHLTSVHSPLDIRIFQKECRSLASAGYDVKVVAPHDHDEVVDGIPILAVPESRSRIARMMRCTWRVYRAALRQKADVYHFHDPELIPFGLLLRAQGKKVVYDIHEDYPTKIGDKDYLPVKLRPVIAWLAERMENLSSKFFSALVFSPPDLVRRFNPLNENSVLVQNFAYLNEFRPSTETPWSQRECAVAYMGVIHEGRSVRQMVQAMGLLPDQLKATLKLAGPHRPVSLREELSRLRGWERVEDLGFLDWRGVASVLSRVRAGLILYYSTKGYTYGYSVKLFEYMSAGLPVILNRKSPLESEVVKKFDCGLLVDPLNPAEIAERIEYVLTHPVEAEAMGRRGREAVEKHYNWKSEERKLLSLYGQLSTP